jgi:cobalt/nickel transport system permease protein
VHHVILDHWSQGSSFLHSLDPRAKIVALLVFLIALSTTPGDAFLPLGLDAIMLIAGILVAGLPIASLARRALVVVPFSFTFALISYLAGDRIRAIGLVEKSYLSAAAVLLMVGTTPLPVLLHGLESLGVPRLFILIVQFLYRYLFVISEQAQHMLVAAGCRRGLINRRESSFRAATGAVSVLFARSFARAEGIHQAMLARGFSGHFTTARSLSFGLLDVTFAVVTSALIIGVRESWRLL